MVLSNICKYLYAILLGARSELVNKTCQLLTNMEFRVYSCLINCSIIFLSSYISTHFCPFPRNPLKYSNFKIHWTFTIPQNEFFISHLTDFTETSPFGFPVFLVVC